MCTDGQPEESQQVLFAFSELQEKLYHLSMEARIIPALSSELDNSLREILEQPEKKDLCWYCHEGKNGNWFFHRGSSRLYHYNCLRDFKNGKLHPLMGLDDGGNV